MYKIKKLPKNIEPKEEIKQEIDIAQEELSSADDSLQENVVQEQSNPSGAIIIKQRKKTKTKEYANFYLRIKTINMIDKYANKTGMNKSELVDTLLSEAFNRLQVK